MIFTEETKEGGKRRTERRQPRGYHQGADFLIDGASLQIICKPKSFVVL